MTTDHKHITTEAAGLCPCCGQQLSMKLKAPSAIDINVVVEGVGLHPGNGTGITVTLPLSTITPQA
jgi:hypothetical protein